MKTDLGEIKILVNNEENNYVIKELEDCCHYFHVKHRLKLTCKIPKQLIENISIKCLIISNDIVKFEPCIETGENLALVSFYRGRTKLSIGTKGDIPGTQYVYLDNGIELILQKNKGEVYFYVAWLEMKDVEKEDIYTWFAADPAFDI
ncbi:hypothetical protein [Harryflintia acetispora]|uniref:hypothetical protein n=1 Tax=Harryflintia acetispora TaxID=1849041 RepID=UPI001053CE33|nr:hypothetical protein [Harryflintia acetispora]